MSVEPNKDEGPATTITFLEIYRVRHYSHGSSSPTREAGPLAVGSVHLVRAEGMQEEGLAVADRHSLARLQSCDSR